MDAKKKEGNMKKNVITLITILVVVVSLAFIAVLVANSNFSFLDFMIKLHGG